MWRDDLNRHAESVDATKEIDRRIRKYVRICDKLKNYQGSDKVINSILRDQTSLPTESGITLTWPVHASFCYVISDYSFNKGDIIVHSVRLYPEFLTTESGTEKELGVVLKRPV